MRNLQGMPILGANVNGGGGQCTWRANVHGGLMYMGGSCTWGANVHAGANIHGEANVHGGS